MGEPSDGRHPVELADFGLAFSYPRLSPSDLRSPLSLAVLATVRIE